MTRYYEVNRHVLKNKDIMVMLKTADKSYNDLFKDKMYKTIADYYRKEVSKNNNAISILMKKDDLFEIVGEEVIIIEFDYNVNKDNDVLSCGYVYLDKETNKYYMTKI